MSPSVRPGAGWAPVGRPGRPIQVLIHSYTALAADLRRCVPGTLVQFRPHPACRP
ncbi:MSL complex subunit 3 [Homo sapiens]|uniref:MSL complex subunit 3 n=1 Tax=Homo sapiens TaxID=9606 RepID=A0A3B3IS16_HUMAN|nr:MSL complex subunit 3 [Homo sapiens]KAI3998851.1 MSL complex subunit 3 [Homo sapiens]